MRVAVALAASAMMICIGACATPEIGLPGDLRALIAEQAPRSIAVAYGGLPDDPAVDLNGDLPFHAASTMKIAVMIEVMRQATTPPMSLDDEVAIHNEFHSIADGSNYALSADDDSDAGLYSRIGGLATLRELTHRMIQRSSNLATNLLIEVVTPTAIQATIESLGTTSMQVLRGVEDIAAFERGINNTTTARDLRVLLTSIATGKAASPAACQEMIDILGGQQFNEMIPAGLPPGTRVAHKTGQITGVHHDAAIVYPETGRGYVLVVLTKGYGDAAESAAVIAQISAMVWGDRGR